MNVQGMNWEGPVRGIRTNRAFMHADFNCNHLNCCFQFNSYDPVDGRITEWEFADMLLTYSSFHEKKKQKIIKKVKKCFKENSQV